MPTRICRLEGRLVLVIFLPSLTWPCPSCTSLPFELGGCRSVTAWRCCFLAILGHWALIALLWIVVIVYFAMEATLPMKPLASANEDTAIEPFRAVVAGGSTVIRPGVPVVRPLATIERLNA